MTPEEKQLLLKDLCARLPYGVICKTKKGDGHLNSINQSIFGTEYGININPLKRNYFSDGITEEQDIKPYLRPMSSMTEEEKEKLKEEHKKDEKIYVEVLERIANGDESARGTAIPHFAADWCNKTHFDYRGMIEKGLALESPEGMYKSE